jgi:regulator of CtrA degradation
MHVASWLLLQRAVNEGELSAEDAGREKTKVRINALDPLDPEVLSLLPPRLVELIEQSFRLHDRVQHLDAAIYSRREPELADNAVATQIDLLRAAFAQRP